MFPKLICFTDLQGVYVFILSDGGMGHRRNGQSDVKMTSYALDMLAQAAVPEWQDQLLIDTAVLNGLAMWLVQRQNATTGAFPHTGTTIHDPKLRVSRLHDVKAFSVTCTRKATLPTDLL